MPKTGPREARAVPQSHFAAYLVQSEGQSGGTWSANTSLGGSEEVTRIKLFCSTFLVYQLERYFGHVPAEADHLFTWHAHAFATSLI